MKKNKYLEVYEDVKKKIESGYYPIGEVIPTGDELAKEYRCSKLTVTKGLDLLAADGIIQRIRGQGTTVLRMPDSKTLPTLGSTHGLHNAYGASRVSSTIHVFEIILPPIEVAKFLDIDDKSHVYHIIRTRCIDEIPYSWEDTYMPLSVIPGLTENHLHGSIYNYITEELNLKPKVSHVWLKAHPSNQNDIKFLALEDNNFIVEVEKIASLATGDVFEYSKTRHKHDRFVFESFIVDN